jgi:hypothetical protein
MLAPEVDYDPITGEFWLTWRAPDTRIDVTLRNREELRAMVCAALEAAAGQDREQAHADPHAGVG